MEPVDLGGGWTMATTTGAVTYVDVKRDEPPDIAVPARIPVAPIAPSDAMALVPA